MLKKWQIKALEELAGWDEFNLTQFDVANQKKQKLLAMAKNREKRPDQRTHKLGQVLRAYTCKGTKCFDPIFNKKIRKIAPQWFVSQSDVANQKKQKLLAMARKRELRPHNKKHSLGRVLSFYTSKNNECYDPVFDKQIRKLAPHWFVSKSDITKSNKKKLLLMAKNKNGKPVIGKHPLAAVFHCYTNPNHVRYDDEFRKQIHAIAPYWLITQYDIANKKRKKLLEIAKRGGPRPNKRLHKLGAVLGEYTNPKSECYNPKFDKQIRELAPHWFK